MSSDAARARQGSVRVARLSVGPVEKAENASAAPGGGTINGPSTGGRRRAITISDRLHNDFDNRPSQAAASVGRRGSVGSRRARATSVSSPLARQSADLEPSVVVEGADAAPGSPRSRRSSHAPPMAALAEEQHHQQEEVDLLDVIDPEVATATYWSNVSSAIAVPPLPFLNRAPVVKIDTPHITKSSSMGSSTDELDLHAEHLVEQNLDKKAKFKKVLKGLWAFMKTPVGVFFTIYGIAVVFWGAALVLILVHAIPMPSDTRRDEWVEICSQILNGLFTITGVGLIPWRTIDTYRMGVIWTYANRVWRRRQHRGLEPLSNVFDLPQHVAPVLAPAMDKEKLSDIGEPVEQQKVSQRQMTDNSAKYSPATAAQLEKGHKQGLDPLTLLTEEEEERLLYQQLKFQHSQTWYRPHETATHYAFPLRWALIICILFDGNSIFQCLLCASMWGYIPQYPNWTARPSWQTAMGIVLSFLCGIAAAVMIWQGGKRTKKVTEVEKAIRVAAEERKARKKAEQEQHPSFLKQHVHMPHLHSAHSAKGHQGATEDTTQAGPTTSADGSAAL